MDGLDRRTWIGRVGAVVAGTVALAGCSGPDEDGGGDEGGEEEAIELGG
ncbi:MAG: hypothetical protein V5A44_05570 [Haloarculaceae archaeon]